MSVVAANPLIEVVPGLMIWTLLCFGITFFVLRRWIFGPVQKAIDDRRDRIRQAIEEADKARAEVADLTVIATSKVTGKVLNDEDHRRLIDDAIGELDFSALEEVK